MKSCLKILRNNLIIINVNKCVFLDVYIQEKYHSSAHLSFNSITCLMRTRQKLNTHTLLLLVTTIFFARSQDFFVLDVYYYFLWEKIFSTINN